MITIITLMTFGSLMLAIAYKAVKAENLEKDREAQKKQSPEIK